MNQDTNKRLWAKVDKVRLSMDAAENKDLVPVRSYRIHLGYPSIGSSTKSCMISIT